MLLIVLACAYPAAAQNEPGVAGGFAKQGGYVGISAAPAFRFDGITFDGDTVYQEVDGEELALLPRVDNHAAVRALLGYRYQRAAFEVSYERMRLHGNFAEFPVEAVYQTLNADGRLFFLPKSRFQPHVLLGFSYPWLNVEDGSYLEPNVGDARWKGLGLNTEAGMTVYPHRQLGVSVGYAYRVVWFDRMTGVSDRLFYLRPRFRETSGSIVISSMVIF